MRVGPVLDGELLDLAQQPLLAVADLGDERLRGVAVDSTPSRAASACSHLGSSLAFIVASARTSPPAALTASTSALGAL